MSELLLFKNVTLHPGDILRLSPNPDKTILPEGAEVAAIDVHDDGYLIVLLPERLAHLGDQQHLLNIPPDHLETLAVIEEAADAIPKRSGGQQFQQHQRVSCMAGGVRYHGQVIAAMDEVVVARIGDHSIVGQAKDFTGAWAVPVENISA